MKKIITIVYFALLAVILSICSNKPVLHVLNWGDYINTNFVRDFEKTYGVQVKIEVSSSNEHMCTKIERGATAYDVAIPSDYMVEKLYKEGLLNEIDFDKQENYSEDVFLADLEDYRNEFFENNQSYGIPYFGEL
jgi:spermidine/putrescine-binding protein